MAGQNNERKMLTILLAAGDPPYTTGPGRTRIDLLYLDADSTNPGSCTMKGQNITNKNSVPVPLPSGQPYSTGDDKNGWDVLIIDNSAGLGTCTVIEISG